MKRFEFVRSLMMVVVLAASMSAFAVGKPQVFDVRFVLRTTVAMSGALNNAENPFLYNEDAETVIYREPKTVTWHGLIWGVGSNAIAGNWEEFYGSDEQESVRVSGCVMWDKQTKSVTYLANESDLTDAKTVPGCGFGWQFFNVIGLNGRLCEGVWTMTQDGESCGECCTLFSMVGSGFGTLTLAGTRSEDELLEVTDNSRIESIAGDLTGWMKSPAMTTETGDGCTFCGDAPIYGECEFATEWNYCACDDYLDDMRTAVHGTWVIKYNPFYSYQYGKVTSILDTACFDDLSAVSTAVQAVEYAVLGIDPTGCDELEAALAAAKANVKAAEAAVEAVSYTNLKKVETAANANVLVASNAWASAVKNCQTMTEIYDASSAWYEKAVYQQTNVNATIVWKNSSQDEVTTKVVGCAAISAFVAEHKYYTLIKMETTIPGLYGIRTCTTWEQCAALVKEHMEYTVEQARTLVTAKENLQTAQYDVVTTQVAYNVAKDELAAAQNDLANINLLQYKAEVELQNAQTTCVAAQAAYDNAGCGD